MIVYAASDLIFATKIRSTAEALGVPTRPARNAQMLQNRLDQVDDGKLNDPVACVLLDLEMGDDALDMLKKTKAHNPDIPVIAFGSHVAFDLLNAARQTGADAVMARSEFSARLPEILQQYGAVV